MTGPVILGRASRTPLPYADLLACQLPSTGRDTGEEGSSAGALDQGRIVSVAVVNRVEDNDQLAGSEPLDISAFKEAGVQVGMAEVSYPVPVGPDDP